MDHAICSTFSDDLRISESLDCQPEQVADQSQPDSEAAAHGHSVLLFEEENGTLLC